MKSKLLVTTLLFVSTCGFADMALGQAAPGQIAFTRIREDVSVPGDYRLEAEIWVMNADGSGARRLTRNRTDDFGIAWAPDGKTLAFGATQFEPNGGGELAPVTQHIYLIAVTGGEPVLISPREMRAQFPTWSPDGKRIAFHGSATQAARSNDVYIMNADGTGLRQLTKDQGANQRADWSPDGRKLAFQSTRDGSSEIFVMDADGSNVVQLTQTDSTVQNQSPDWSPDGKRILFQRMRDGNTDIYVMNEDGTGIIRLTTDPARELDPEWSSDGTRIVFDRDVAFGNRPARQMFSMNADGTDVRQITTPPSSNGHAASSRVR